MIRPLSLRFSAFVPSKAGGTTEQFEVLIDLAAVVTRLGPKAVKSKRNLAAIQGVVSVRHLPRKEG